MTHRRNCPHCDEPMEYYPGRVDELDPDPEPNIFSCPECGWEEEE